MSDPDLRLAHGTDASFYRLVPERIVRLDSPMSALCARECAANWACRAPFAPPAPALSGQALSDCAHHLTDSWRGHRILDEGARIALQPGVTAPMPTAIWHPWGARLADPASINACKLGGIAANNASGMCRGTAHNSYHTLHAMTLTAGRWHRAGIAAISEPRRLCGDSAPGAAGPGLPPCVPKCWRMPSLPPRSATSTGSRTPPATPSTPCSTG